jgi:hypothetical protein
MALVRRHWKLALFNLLVISIAAGLLLYRLNGSHTAVASSPETPATQTSQVLDIPTYSRIQDIRKRVGLTNRDLAALGCDQDQATTVLNQIVQWYQSNQTQLTTAESTESAAHEAYDEAVVRVNTGPRSQEALDQIGPSRQAYLTAAAQHTTIYNGVIGAVSSVLSSAQAQSWQTARANGGLPERYRYIPELNGETMAQLQFALSKYGEGSPQAQSLEQTIDGGSASAIGAVESNIQNNLNAVIAAEGQVLPLPTQLAIAPPQRIAPGQGN